MRRHEQRAEERAGAVERSAAHTAEGAIAGKAQQQGRRVAGRGLGRGELDRGVRGGGRSELLE